MDYERECDGAKYIIDYYAVLGVPPHADMPTLRDAYRQKTTEYHPDKYVGRAPEFVQLANMRIRVIDEAKNVLFDEAKKKEYDQTLKDWSGSVSKNGISSNKHISSKYHHRFNGESSRK